MNGRLPELCDPSAAEHGELCPIVSQSLFSRYSVVIPVVIAVVIASPHESPSRDSKCALKGICNILNLFLLKPLICCACHGFRNNDWNSDWNND